MNKINLPLLILLTLCLISACKKPAGEGGKASIKGRVWVEDWNAAFTVKNGEYAGADREVYIIYGDEVNFGQRLRANHLGEFEFLFLNKGKYKVYVYSKDKTLKSQSGETYVLKEVEITKKKENLDVGDLLIYE